MSGIEIRFSAVGDDIRAMKALWKAAFDDPDEVVDAFFGCLYVPGGAVLALEDGKTVGCVYLLPGAELVTAAGERTPCTYFYALAVDAARRGNGIGKALTAYCASLAAQSGETLCLMPGDDGLRQWYAAQGFSDLSTAEMRTFTAGDGAGKVRVRTVGAKTYAEAREALLSGKPHASLPETFFRFQEALCRPGNGALLSLTDADGHAGLVCAEREGEAVLAKEMLFDGDLSAAGAAIAAFFGAEHCRAAVPGKSASAVMAHGERNAPGLWWGPVFD